jgi:hypothetical protein
MNKKEYYDLVSNTEINKTREQEVTGLYKCEFDQLLLKVISAADEVDFFDEERRALSYKEILSPEELLGIDAINEGIVPVIDAYDCTFIVYLTKEAKWAKFSTVDKTIYKKRNALNTVL